MSDWMPTTKQKEALVRSEFEIMYGGARGGGKTDCGMAWLLYNIDHPEFRALVIRRNSTDLDDWIDRARTMYAKVGGKATGNPPEFVFPSGAIIRTGHLKDESAYEKYQGHEYHRMLIEELTHIPRQEDYLKLISSCRSTVEGLKPQIFATTNPGNAGHEWVKERFVDCSSPGEPTVDKQTGRSRIFIPAKVNDNPHLMEKDPDYVRFLDGLPDGLRQAWRDGSWDDFDIEGAYYSAQMREAELDGRIGEVPYETSIPVDTWWDLGIGDSMVIWFSQVVGNEIRLIDYYENSGESLQFYGKILQERGYVYDTHYMPHDAKVRELSTGKSRKQIAESLGIRPIKVVPQLPVDDGINAVRMILNKCWFDREKCQEGIKTLKNYRKEWDDKHGTWKPKPLHDWASHGADAFRQLGVQIDKRRSETKVFRHGY